MNPTLTPAEIHALSDEKLLERAEQISVEEVNVLIEHLLRIGALTGCGLGTDCTKDPKCTVAGTECSSKGVVHGHCLCQKKP